MLLLKSKPFRILLYILTPMLLLLVLYKTFAVVDLRTDIDKNAINEDKAKGLISDMGKAHGIENWQNIKTYSVSFEDEFFGFIGSKSHAYGANKVNMTLNYIPDSFDGRIDFTSVPLKGETWGIQSWDTYIKKGDGIINFTDNADITFWLPTYQYFIEFPMRIQKATAFNYAGEKKIDGIMCEGVIASWETIEPQSDIDQYLLWIDKNTKRMVRLEYTVREQFRFLTGAVNFKGYEFNEGILLPATMPIESNLVPVGLLHEMRILDFKPNILSLENLRPNASLPVLGDSK